MLRNLRLVLLSAIASMAAPVAAFADYPDHPITIVVPYTSGGTVDLMARALSKEMYKDWDQQVIVDNRPGAGGSVGTDYVAHAPHDGYTLLLSTNSPLTTNLALYPSLHYSTLRDFVPVVLTGEDGNAVLANPNLPVKSFRELIALAKREPGNILSSTSGNGTTADLSLAEINKVTGVKITAVPYAGGVPSLTAAVSGEVQIVMSDLVPALPLIHAGKLRGLATTSPRRPQVDPALPTIAEQGYPGFSIVTWNGMVAPKGTPGDIVNKLNVEINKILKEPDFRQQMNALGIDILGGSSTEFGDLLKKDIPRWAQIVRDAGMKLH
jgi:tripartite-type tricarboxylate transporter receptor subunit TctC